MDKGGFKSHACCWTWAPGHLSISKGKSVYCRKGYLLVHETAGPAPGEKATHLGKPYLQIDLSCTNLSAGHIRNSFFKCVFFSDVRILHLLILMRALRNSWEQRETRAPRGMHSLLVKAMTAIVWAAWTTTRNLLKGDKAYMHFHWNIAIVKFGLRIF